MSILENAISPATAVPVITRIIDAGEDNRLTRTQENLIIEGSNLASVTAIQILNGNLVLQTIQGSVVQTFINSHNQIIIPPGHINETAEGADGTRTVVLWNTVGKSDASTAIGIATGVPVVTGTSRDRLNYDRVEHNVDIYGYGFKSAKLSPMMVMPRLPIFAWKVPMAPWCFLQMATVPQPPSKSNPTRTRCFRSMPSRPLQMDPIAVSA